MVLVYPFLMLGYLLPLADVAIAGFRYLSARQALRAFGQSIQYSPPDDLANTSSWRQPPSPRRISSTIRSPTSNSFAATAALPARPQAIQRRRNIIHSTTVTLSPIVLSSVLCSSSCTFTLSYSERFQ